MRAFINTAASIAVAGLTVCAFLSAQLPFEPWPGQAAAQTAASAPRLSPR